MWYSGSRRERENRAFYEKAYRWEQMPQWEERWLKLSVPARFHFLTNVKAAKRAGSQITPSTDSGLFPPEVLEELTAAGFVQVPAPAKAGLSRRVLAVDGVLDFANRLRCLRRFHLLTPTQSRPLEGYVDFCFFHQPV